MGQGRRGRGRAAPAPGQLSLDDVLEEEKYERPAPCLYLTGTARGLAARLAEWEAWLAEHGHGSAYARSHAWRVVTTCPDTPTDRCQPTVLTCDLSAPRGYPPPCGGHDRSQLYRGACRRPGCLWEGPERDSWAGSGENPAAEDALNHAWPGWRDLPVAPDFPHIQSGTSKADLRALARWAEQVNAIYPEGWLEAGGPVRTLRSGRGTRHVPDRTPYGGYDVAAVAPGGEDG